MRKTFQIDKLISGLFVVCILMFTSTLAFSEVIDLSPSQDTFVDSRKANKSYGSNSYIRLRESKKADRHGLIKFDMNEIPDGSEIQSAKLSVFVTYKRSFNNILTVYEALGGWSESTKWSNKPSMSSLSEDSVSIGSGGVYYELDVTGIVQDWVDGAADNNGLYLIVSNGHIYINSSENSSNQPILNVKYGSSEPEPAPEPKPNPGPGELVPDTGVSDAPLFPANKRVIVVSIDGDGDYRTISGAINDARPGDTIQVKDGIYVERVNLDVNGTRDLPIALVNYPGHKPVIDPGGGEYPPECCPPGGVPRVEVNAEWLIIEGFEIRYGWDGVKLYNGHNTIRNNWIHHNRYQGILIVSTEHILIDGNTIEYNGTDAGACFDDGWGGESPRHCHAIYMSDYFCEGMANITIRMNTLRNHGGKGVGWNGRSCEAKMTNTLVENNLIENNSFGMFLYHNVENSLIRNNTFVMETYPETDDTSHAFIAIRNSTDNTVENNIFYSTRDNVSGVHIRDSESIQNTFNYNLWHVSYEWWVWEGASRSNFFGTYKKYSGWGDNSLCCRVDPGFSNIVKQDYRIVESSKAKDKGNDESCPVFDFDLDSRGDDNLCDIGMDEYL